MDDRTLEDKAKSAQATELIDKFNLDGNFNYATNSLLEQRDSGRLKGINVDKYKGLID